MHKISRRTIPFYTRQIVRLAALWLLPASLLMASTPPVVDLEDIKAKPSQHQVTHLIRQHIDSYHYRKVPLNDALSGDIFDRYLESLDPNRLFFVAEDIKQFRQHRFAIDDYIRESELDAVFAIFSIFRSRTEQAISYAMELVDEEFDFARDEKYHFDRSEAAWQKTALSSRKSGDNASKVMF